MHLFLERYDHGVAAKVITHELKPTQDCKFSGAASGFSFIF